MPNKLLCSWLICLSFLLVSQSLCDPHLSTEPKCQKTAAKEPCAHTNGTIDADTLKSCYVHKIDGLIAFKCLANCSGKYVAKHCRPVCLGEIVTCRKLCGQEECARECFPKKDSTGRELCRECDIDSDDCRTYILIDHRDKTQSTTTTTTTTTTVVTTKSTEETTTTTTPKPPPITQSPPTTSPRPQPTWPPPTRPTGPPDEGFAQSWPYIVGCVVVTLLILLLLYLMLTRNPEARPVVVYSMSDSGRQNPHDPPDNGEREQTESVYTAGMSNILLPQSSKVRSKTRAAIKSGHSAYRVKRRQSKGTPRSPGSFSSGAKSPNSFSSRKNPFSVG